MRASDFLIEMDLKPGDIQQIEAKLEKYDEEKEKLSNYRYFLMQQKNMKPSSLDNRNVELIKKIDGVIAEYERVIEQLTNELKAMKKETSLYKLFERIEREASFAIKSFKNTQKVLYRGSRKQDDAFIGRPWTDRKPTHSDSAFSNLYDQALTMYGAKALRSNSLFTTSDRSLAHGFGSNLHIIFPIDGFHYTWSTVEKDIVFNTESWIKAIDEDVVAEFMETLKPYWTDEAHEYYLREFVSMYMPRGRDEDYVREYFTKEALFDPKNIKNMEGFFPRNLEVAQLRAIRNMAFRENTGLNITDERDYKFIIDDSAELKDFMGPGSLGNIIENYGVKIDTDFEEALKSRHEIMINGTYFAIHNKYAEEVEEWLGIDGLTRF